MADEIVVRLTYDQAEALSDARPDELADDWPDEWPEHAKAHAAAIRAVEDVLDGQAEEVDCLVWLRYAVDVADHALHGAMFRAARDADCIILGNTLHAVDGCHIARKAHPAAVEPGGFRGRRLPVFITQAEAVRWLSARATRRACKRCIPGA